MTWRLGTRGSRLALEQAESVAKGLRHLGAAIDMIVIRTSGDRLAQVALADFGGKALFVKEIEEALLGGRVDIAVHSLKDVPGALAEGLALAAFPPREDPRDVLVTRAGGTLDDLPSRSVVGTSSLRRRAQVLAHRPDLVIEPIRGNVDTRLAKLEHGGYDAVIVAKAGLARLGLAPQHAVTLDVDALLPAVGQGILGIEVREADREALELVHRLNDTQTSMAALAERSFLLALGADCHTPVAGYACSEGDVLRLTGLVASLDGRTVLRASISGDPSSAHALGVELATELLGRGARTVLDGRGDATDRGSR